MISALADAPIGKTVGRVLLVPLASAESVLADFAPIGATLLDISQPHFSLSVPTPLSLLPSVHLLR